MSSKQEIGSMQRCDGGLLPRMFSNFENLWDAWNTADFKVDVREQGENYVIDAEMPGIRKEDIHVTVCDNVLTISANVSDSREESDGRYLRRERRNGACGRSFSLENIRTDEIHAEMQDGVLQIYCPKEAGAEAQTHRIDIQ